MKKIILVLTVLLLLTGCRSKTPEEPTEPTQLRSESPAFSQEIAQASLDTAMNAAKEAEEYTSEPAYLSELESRVTWTVLTIEAADSETAQAMVKVSAPDLYSVIKALENTPFASAEEIDVAVTDGLREAPLRVQEVLVDFQTDGERWEALLSEEFTDACYGGLLTYREEMYAAMEGA